MGKGSHRGVGDQEVMVNGDLGGAVSGGGFLGLAQLGIKLVLEEAMRQEIEQFLGRRYYERVEDKARNKARPNGHRDSTIDTPVGPLHYRKPLVVHAPDFRSVYHTPYMRRPAELAGAVADMYIDGVSTRKVKRALRSIASDKIRLSRSSVSRITKRIRRNFKEWKTRSLSQLEVVYVFLDAIRLGMRIRRPASNRC